MPWPCIGFPRAAKDLDVRVRPEAESAPRVLQGLTETDLPTEGTNLSGPRPAKPHRRDHAVDGVDFEDAWRGRTVVKISTRASTFTRRWKSATWCRSRANPVTHRKKESRMKSVVVLMSACCAVTVGATAVAQTPTGQVDAHVAAARAAAGQDYRATFVNLCLPAAPPGGGRGAAGRGGAAARGAGGRAAGAAPQTPDRAGWYASPYQVFDNLYWLGTRQHSSWALRTSDGIIIIDTNFAWATQPAIIDGLTTLGLDPRDIKYVLISHAHGDHDQGAAELQRRFGAKVVMGAADWESTLQRPATAAGGVPTRDVAVGMDGLALTLGDTTVTIVATPGHTPGTLSYVFPVKDEGRTVTVAYSGGTLTGAFGTDGKRWDEYVASQQKIARAAADAGASVMLSNHSEYDGAYTRARLVGVKREVGESHPFIVGADNVQRYFTVMAECAMASKLRAGAK
jgi:metallo-beta-lactamase class B